ncbi:MAG TPA: cell division protein CrgA [Streptosporangiaceae bacterium]|nr:cell division protein CrgA [Streptosporangiaceae bacterium]
MPKSRVRKKTVYTPPPKRVRAKASPRWLAPTMVACLVIGLAWIALYYVTNANMPVISTLGYWNMVIGFALIIGGIGLSTRWR